MLGFIEGLTPLLLRPPQSVGLNLARKADNAALIACAKKLVIYANTVVTRRTQPPENLVVT